MKHYELNTTTMNDIRIMVYRLNNAFNKVKHKNINTKK